MSTTTTTPRIYVASLSDYNAGRPHGVWIDATDDVADICQQVRTMLASSPERGADEYAIHDYEGFYGIRIEEYDSLDKVHAIASVLEHHPEPDAVAAWLANDPSVVDVNNADPYDLASAFDDAYRGNWHSVDDYAWDYVDGTGLLDTADELVTRYFDASAFARDLVLGGDIWTAPANGGGIYIFDNNV